MIPLASTLLRGDRTVTQPHDNPLREGAKVFVFNFSSRGCFNSLKFAVLIFLYIPSKTSLLEISRRRRESATNEQSCFGSGRGGGGGTLYNGRLRADAFWEKVEQVPKLLTMGAYLRAAKQSFRSVNGPT